MSNLVDPMSLSEGFWNNLTVDDFSAPIVSIGQGTSQKGIPGKFNFNNGESRDSLPNCKLVHVKKGRILYSATSKSLCGSDNFQKPAPRHAVKFAEDCINCPLQAWGANPEKERVKKEHRLEMIKDLEKPMCHETFNFLMADENCNPFFISFQKTQLKVVSEKLLSRIRTQFGGVPPFHVAFDMSLAKKTGPGVSYYTTVFDNFRQVEPDEAEKMTGIYAAWRDHAAAVLARQFEESDKAYEEQENQEKIVGE